MTTGSALPPASASAPVAGSTSTDNAVAPESNPIFKLSDKEKRALAEAEMDQFTTDVSKQPVGSSGVPTISSGMYKDQKKPEKPISAADAAGKWLFQIVQVVVTRMCLLSVVPVVQVVVQAL